MKRFGDEHEVTARASCLLIKDQLGLQETPKESLSNALILYGSREVILSSSSRALAILPSDSLATESQFDVLESNLFSVMNCFKVFAAWYRARCIASVKSAIRSVITDINLRIFGSISESAVQKNEVASITFLVQVYFSRFMVHVIDILKEAIRLLKSHSENNMSTLLGQIFPARIGGKGSCFDLFPDSTSVGNYVAVDCLAMVLTFIKQVLAIFFDASTSLFGPLMQLQGAKVVTSVLLLCVSISLIGWSIPQIVFEGSKLEQCVLHQPIITEAVTGLDARSFSCATSPWIYLPVDTSQSLNLMGSIGSFDNLHSASMDTGASDRQVDLNHIGLADDTPSLYSWPANDFSTTATPDDEAAALPLIRWYIDASNYIRPGSEFGSTLESSMFINVLELVPREDYASNGIATEHSDGYIVATTDEASVIWYTSQASQNQSSVELELFLPSSAADGDSSIKPMMINIAVGPLYPAREFDGYSDSMQVDDRYSDSTALQVHEVLTVLDHPGLIAYIRDLLFYVWSDNDFIAASLPGSQTSYFLNHEAAPASPLDGNIGAIHCIQSEASVFLSVPGDLWSDRHAPMQFSLDSFALGLGHSLPNEISGGDSSTQMIVAALGQSKELCTIQCREREDAMIYPQLRLSAPSDSTNSFGKTNSYASMNRSKRFSVAGQSSLRISTLEESSHIFKELRQLALVLLILAYHNSDGTANDDPNVALSFGSEMSPGTNLNLDFEDFPDNVADGENGENDILPRSTNIEPSRRELMALRSELGAHWKSPSISKRRMRRSPRARSRPKYFEPTWASG